MAGCWWLAVGWWLVAGHPDAAPALALTGEPSARLGSGWSRWLRAQARRLKRRARVEHVCIANAMQTGRALRALQMPARTGSSSDSRALRRALSSSL